MVQKDCIIHYAIFSDFNRYILGANLDSDSQIFYKKDGKVYQRIPLQDIRDIMANIIMNEYCWNDELGELDKGIYSTSRYDNKIERFGKKYLWMALYKTDALLCDHCAVSKRQILWLWPIKKKDMAVIPYPWLTSEHSTIDPSLLVEKEDDLISFNANLLEDVDGIDNEQWMNEGYQLPAPRLLLKDNEGNDWLLLTSYDGHTTEATDGTIKDLFLYTNAGFIKKMR